MTTRPFQDLRNFIEFLESENHLQHVKGADWNLELGGLSELVWRMKGEACPALLFDEIKGYPAGYRVLTLGVASTYHYTSAMNLEPTSDRRQCIRILKDLTAPTPVPTKEITTGPVLENIIEGKNIDVLQFPAPKFKEYEGGRFLGTGDLVVTRDEENGLLNIGTYRVQVHGPDKITVYFAPGHHGGIHINSYHSKGKPAPVLISLGHAPDLFLSAIEEFPYGVNEFEMAGGRRGEPVEVITEELTGLPMPASSEMVVVGHIYPDTEPVAEEGPFGEFLGYYAGRHTNLIPITVERIYHRNDPVIFAVPHFRPPQDVIIEYRIAPRLWKEMENSGLPGIQEINSLPFGCGGANVVSLKTLFPGHSKQVGLYMASCKTSYLIGYMSIVVDEDIDIHDLDMIMWAVLTRCEPSKDIHIIDDMLSMDLDPVTHDPAKRAVGDIRRGRVVIDATRPFHWKDSFPQSTDISAELKENLLQKWNDSLFSKL